MDSGGALGTVGFRFTASAPSCWLAIGSKGELLTQVFQPAAWLLCGASG